MKLCLFFVCALGVAILPQTDGKSYYLIQSVIDWWQCYTRCQAMGQRFATINNLEEQNEVITLLEDADERGNVWIGGIDVLQNDNFVWVSMALDFNFTNWAKDYPSTDPDSNCALQTMTMQGSWGVPGWETAACHTGHYCICED